MHEEFGREAVVHTHGVDLVHLGGDTWVTSGTGYCPCSHLEQVEAVSADVGEPGECCGVVKASAEIINYIFIKMGVIPTCKRGPRTVTEPLYPPPLSCQAGRQFDSQLEPSLLHTRACC